MATRANIVIKGGGKRQVLYHHWDGYPEGIGKDLENFVKANKGLGSKDMADKIVSGIDSGGERDTSYERTTGIHSDAEYIYTIDTDKGSLSYKKWNWDTEKFDKSVPMIKGSATPNVHKAAAGGRNTTQRASKGNGGKG